MVEPIIKLESVTKRFGSLTVLDELSFEVKPGEKLALIGPSGSGKTTILRMLMTLEHPSEGRITVDGDYLFHMTRGNGLVPANEKHLHEMRRKIGMVFQHFNLFPHKSVLQNVTMAPILTQNVAKADAETRGMELLDMVGLADKAHKRRCQYRN